MEKITPIETTSFMIEVIEYGKMVRQYNDVNYDRFMRVVQDMVKDHMSKDILQGNDEVKNVQINIYTY